MNANSEIETTQSSMNSTLRMGTVPAGFILLGAFFYVLFNGVSALVPELWLSGSRSPAAATLLHAFIMGFLLPFGFAAIYLSLKKYGTKRDGDSLFGQIHYLYYLAGMVVFLIAFSRWDLRIAAHAGFAILAVFMVFAFSTMRDMDQGPRHPMGQITVTTSLSWLALTLFMGMAAAANYYWEFLPMPTVTAIHSGMHAGFGGYFVLLIVGLSYYVFQGNKISTGRRVWTYFLLNGGIYLSVLGMAFTLPTVVVAGALAFLGLLLFMTDTFLGRNKQITLSNSWFTTFLLGVFFIFAVTGLGLAKVTGAAALSNFGKFYLFIWLTLGTALPLIGLLGQSACPPSAKSDHVFPSLILYLLSTHVFAFGILDNHPKTISLGAILLLAGSTGLLYPLVNLAWMRLFASDGSPSSLQATKL